MNNRLLIGFNICGASGAESIDYYRKALDSIYKQTFQDFDIVVVSTLNTKEDREELQRLYPKVDIYCIDEPFPIHGAFNHAIIETLKHRPNNYFGYAYCESGIIFQNNDDLQKLVDRLRNQDEIGILVPQTDNDTGLHLFFGIGSHNHDTSENEKLFQGKDIFYFPPGGACNLHFAIYSRAVFDYYGQLQPSIFKAHTMESTLSFMVGAIHKKWGMLKDVMIHHRKLNSIDSACFDPYAWRRDGNQNWNHPWIIPDIIERLLPSLELGGGYEECEQIMMHDESKWDENYYCLDDRLAPFYKENLFVREDELPHNSIKSHFMKGQR